MWQALQGHLLLIPHPRRPYFYMGDRCPIYLSLPCFVEKVNIWSPTTPRDFSSMKRAPLISLRASPCLAGAEPAVRFVVHSLGLGLRDGGQEWASGDLSSRPSLTLGGCRVCASVSSFVKWVSTFLLWHFVAALTEVCDPIFNCEIV